MYSVLPVSQWRLTGYLTEIMANALYTIEEKHMHMQIVSFRFVEMLQKWLILQQSVIQTQPLWTSPTNPSNPQPTVF